ncbi:MAG: hypothetical protein EB127_02470 [Alphaproteobacteria bacterium]|nr:hypothetical protein [Alphaproteobacteria bacterium]
MGLDMYLRARRYLSYDDNRRNSLRHEFQVPDDWETNEVSFEVGYWRKANAIHKWFVDNIQSGNDNCGEYYLSKVDLQSLRDLCMQVKTEPAKAQDLLPAQSGFFFGSTEYDEGYFADLDHTIAIIDSVLNCEDTGFDYYYSSSW